MTDSVAAAAAPVLSDYRRRIDELSLICPRHENASLSACAEAGCYTARRVAAAFGVLPAVRFELGADGATVRDATTGLEWTRAASITEKRVTWEQASAACEALELAGGGWRLPTRVELLTLVDDTRFDPSIEPIFECKPNWYWTSTAAAPSPGDCAWSVGFGSGGAGWGDRDDDGFVRAVRAGQ